MGNNAVHLSPVVPLTKKKAACPVSLLRRLSLLPAEVCRPVPDSRGHSSRCMPLTASFEIAVARGGFFLGCVPSKGLRCQIAKSLRSADYLSAIARGRYP